MLFHYHFPKSWIHIDNDDVDIDFKQASSGMQSIIPMWTVFCDSLYGFGRYIIIEEPELNLFPTLQVMLISKMVERLKTAIANLVVTTHSPYLVKQLNYGQLRLVEDNANVKKVTPVNPASMPYVSLNEVNYLAFGEVSEEYHDELYGHLEYRGDLNVFFATQLKFNYVKMKRDGSTVTEQ